MTRDIDERMMIFGVALTIERIALNMPQIEELQPPPNPAKLTDSRCLGYIKRYGKKSWELDALEPSYLTALVEKEVLKYRNDDRWSDMLKKEDSERQKLSDVLDDLSI
ncbi:MAG: hypothetical protein A2017_06450 [Lentisphaerae bacterium GWF2_44_16]|nr:MAG: hypothetical protein A2017_06450 [Lentisphaerae bacterium GWF2_44_16]